MFISSSGKSFACRKSAFLGFMFQDKLEHRCRCDSDQTLFFSTDYDWTIMLFVFFRWSFGITFWEILTIGKKLHSFLKNLLRVSNSLDVGVPPCAWAFAWSEFGTWPFRDYSHIEEERRIFVEPVYFLIFLYYLEFTTQGSFRFWKCRRVPLRVFKSESKFLCKIHQLDRTLAKSQKCFCSFAGDVQWSNGLIHNLFLIHTLSMSTCIYGNVFIRQYFKVWLLT